MQEEQTSLFNLSPKENKPAPVLTIADKAYQRLSKAGLADKLHIYPHSECVSIVLSIIQQPSAPLGETMELLCKRVNKTRPHCYYHFKGGHFIQYNGWIMNMVYKEFTKQKNEKENTDEIQMDSTK